MTNRLEDPQALPDIDRVTMLNIGPNGLDRYLELVGDRCNPLIKYRDGRLTLVSPSQRHERGADRLDDLIKMVCDELGIDSRATASTLYRRPGMDHGLEADKTYYVAHEPDVRGVAGDIDLTIHPPPDLAIEVVVSHSPVKSLEVCRELGVAEVWVYWTAAGELEFWHLDPSGQYVSATASRAFPFLSPADVLPWVEAISEEPDRLWRGRLRKWVCAELAPRLDPGARSS
jgi:Uma2 family endonuclease